MSCIDIKINACMSARVSDDTVDLSIYITMPLEDMITHPGGEE
jgi:hypothetical protein